MITEYLTSWQDNGTYFSFQEGESFAADCPVFAVYMKKVGTELYLTAACSIVFLVIDDCAEYCVDPH